MQRRLLEAVSLKRQLLGVECENDLTDDKQVESPIPKLSPKTVASVMPSEIGE